MLLLDKVHLYHPSIVLVFLCCMETCIWEKGKESMTSSYCHLQCHIHVLLILFVKFAVLVHIIISLLSSTMCICIFMYVRMYVMCVHTCVSTYICMHICMHACICVHICMYVCTYICACRLCTYNLYVHICVFPIHCLWFFLYCLCPHVTSTQNYACFLQNVLCGFKMYQRASKVIVH